MLPHNTEGAYLFYASRIEFSNLPLPRRPEKVIWALSHEESPRNVAELMHEKILNIFNYSSTFSRYSDVPFPLQSIVSLENVTSTKFFVETQQKNLLLKEIGPILYLQSDCEASTERDKYVLSLQKFQRIDSYGICLRNKELPSGVKGENEDYLNSLDDTKFLNFVARYKFVIAIENGVCEDYITEKLWRAIHVGVVPIYFGSPSIRDWLPNQNSAILLEDFPTPELLSQHIDELLRNDQLYEAYLEHKTKRKISNQKLIRELHERPYQTGHREIENEFICFLCKKLHEDKNTVHIVTKRHYDCPKPISALTQQVEQTNSWVQSWEFTARYVVNALYNKIMK
ncbi:alpha-(1,3)-fucosyltransferase 10-like isoform X2 [Hyposmocoma kahamanoa]|uniref:alpha-(1,3)-fucosyltransferase 10-like isoform X2 n=1 Tax=Hyposmocoma kahamanoa TaxID=1477025 RepID=UPI000E6D99D7|nr:alpha-(1,3)-fucosyltransferase 10-like isoform X2 [Hyposmocoma kahamanoa]